MFKNMKISIKILLVILVIAMGSLLVVFAASYYFMNGMVDEFEQTNLSLGINASGITRESLQSQAEYYLLMLMDKQAESANGELYAVNRIVTESAAYTENLYANSELYAGHEMPRPDQTENGVACSKYFLVKGVEETEAIREEVRTLSGCEYMFGPMLENNEMLDNIYIGTESGISYRYSRSNLYNEDYNPKERDWYKTAAASPDTLVWLPTYLDSYGNTCITVAKTYRDRDGALAGVVASDMLLTSIIDNVMGLKVGETGTCFVLDAEMGFIAHPDMKDASFDGELSAHFGDTAFADALRASDSGIVETVYEGRSCYVAFSRLKETGWVFCASVETSEVTQPADRAKAESDEAARVSQEFMQKRLLGINRMFMIYFALIGLIVIMTSFAVAGTITRPIQRLAANIKEIGEGHFDKKIEVTSRDEVGQLGARFNEMQDSLHHYTEHLKKITAEKERIGTELHLATQIQADMLPHIYPAFPERSEFDVYATMTPAKEVGGDFYDFFLVDDSHLALVMADVSGKGVPAALFMMVSKILVQNSAMTGKSPSEVLRQVNEQICANNREEMFVTVWLGILDLTSGKITAANAGHEYPALKASDGSFELIKDKHGFVVGGMEG
ncbi:MAG: SpoIIE family protein phosphatase, partial [Selenomonadaceae bacterium]|nr:SpoIIE family protein phosphatase [Selenomonadaceae bacterium]